MKKILVLIVFCVSMISCVPTVYHYDKYVVSSIEMLSTNCCLYHLQHNDGKFISKIDMSGNIGEYKVGEVVTIKMQKQ